MPTKEFDRGNLFFGNEETGFFLLGEQAEIELDENCEASENIPFLDIGGEYEFTAEIQPPERMTVRDVILGLCGFDVEKLKQNNWRKMHGMVMHRRRGKCKSLKNGKTGRQRKSSRKKTFVLKLKSK